MWKQFVSKSEGNKKKMNKHYKIIKIHVGVESDDDFPIFKG